MAPTTDLGELLGPIRELRQGIEGMASGQRELEQRLRRLESGYPQGFLPVDQGGSGGPGGNAERGGFARFLQATLLEGDPAKGGVLVPADQADEVWQMLNIASIGLASGFRVIDTDSDELHLPTVTDDGASWTAEAATIAVSEPAFAQIVARPKKLASYCEISSELLMDSSPAALEVVSDSVTRAMARVLDKAFFVGSGTPPEPLGIYNVPGIQTVPAVGALTSLDPFITAISKIEAVDLAATAIYLHPNMWAALMGIKEATGSQVPVLASSGGVGAGVQKSLLGIAVYTSSQLPIDKALVAAAPQVAAVRRSEARIETSADAKFQNDVVALRCVSRWDLVMPQPLAACALLGITGVAALEALQVEPQAEPEPEPEAAKATGKK